MLLYTDQKVYCMKVMQRCQERGKNIRRRERFLLRDAEKVGFVVMILKVIGRERERESPILLLRVNFVCSFWSILLCSFLVG